MKPDLAKLRAVTKAATPGPWDYDDEVMNEPSPCNQTVYPEADSEHSIAFVNGMVNGTKDAAFIAAANPETVLALLDELESIPITLTEIEWRAILAENEQFKTELEDLRAVCKHCLDGVLDGAVTTKELEMERDQLRGDVERLGELLMRCSCCSELCPHSTLVLCGECDQTEEFREQVTNLEKIIADSKIDHDALLEEHRMVLGQRDRLLGRVAELDGLLAESIEGHNVCRTTCDRLRDYLSTAKDRARALDAEDESS